MDEKVFGFCLFVLIAAVLAGIAKLIQRGRANPGVILILLLMPVLFIFGMQLIYEGVPRGYSDLSDELIIGVIASLIAGVILMGIRKK